MPKERLPAVTGTVTPALARFTDDVFRQLSEQDEKDVSLEIVERHLSGTTLDSVLGTEVRHARDLVGVPITISAVKWLRSDQPGLGFYAIFTASDPFDEVAYPVSCGSSTVMAQLWRLNDLDLFPAKVVINEGQPTASGGRPMTLSKA